MQKNLIHLDKTNSLMPLSKHIITSQYYYYPPLAKPVENITTAATKLESKSIHFDTIELVYTF